MKATHRNILEGLIWGIYEDHAEDIEEDEQFSHAVLLDLLGLQSVIHAELLEFATAEIEWFAQKRASEPQSEPLKPQQNPINIRSKSPR